MTLASLALLPLATGALWLHTQYLQTADGKLAYDDTGGTGPLVVAIPGMGDVRAEYRFLAPVLKEAGYRVVTLDVRGFGESSARWKDYSTHAVGGDVLRLIAHLGQTKAIVMGNSFAAGAAAWAAHDKPERVSALVLLGPVLRDPAESAPWYARMAMSAAFAGPWRVSVWLQYWNSLFTTVKPPDHAAYRLSLEKNMKEPGRMDALKAMMALSKADTSAILNKLQKPALVVMGSKDPDFKDPEAEAKWAAQQLGAQIKMIDGAGHYPHAEMPDKTGPAVVDFLRSQSVR